jgi:hypothetical protein
LPSAIGPEVAQAPVPVRVLARVPVG